MRKWRILVADDNAEHLDIATEAIQKITHELAPNGFDIVEEPDLSVVRHRLKTEKFDVAVVDVRVDADGASGAAGDNTGQRALHDAKGSTFVPFIFYTANPGLVEGEASTFVVVVSKTEGVNALAEAVKSILESRLLILKDHLEKLSRELLWNEMPTLLNKSPSEATEAAARLASLLARKLMADSTRGLLGLSLELRHPREAYEFPPFNPHLSTGDLLRRGSDDSPEYCVVLNPACDLVGTGSRKPKVADALVALCKPAEQDPDVAAWIQAKRDDKSKNKQDSAKERAKSTVTNRDPSLHFLPGFDRTPDLLANFRSVSTVPISTLEAKWERLATLTSPYAESLNARFVQFFGRIGVPEIDIDVVFARVLETEDGP